MGSYKLKNKDERNFNFGPKRNRARLDFEKSLQRILTRETRPLIRRHIQDLGHTIRTLRVPRCDRCAAVKDLPRPRARSHGGNAVTRTFARTKVTYSLSLWALFLRVRPRDGVKWVRPQDAK